MVAAATTKEQAESESMAAEAMAAQVAAEKSLPTAEASVKRSDTEVAHEAEQATQATQATQAEEVAEVAEATEVAEVEEGQRIVNGKKVGHSAEVKARMDEYTALNNGDANNHLHGKRAAVKESAAATSAPVTAAFRSPTLTPNPQPPTPNPQPLTPNPNP